MNEGHVCLIKSGSSVAKNTPTHERQCIGHRALCAACAGLDWLLTGIEKRDGGKEFIRPGV